MDPNVRLTTSVFLSCTAILAFLDLLFILIIRKAVSHEQFKRLQWQLVISGGIFFLLVWTGAMLWAWDWFYVFIFPPWARYALPFIFGVGYPLIAYGMTWLSLKWPGNPAVTWCVLGGVEGFLSHLYAIYGLGAASKPPVMHGVSQFSVLIFAIFEKAFYWSVILLLVWVFIRMRGPKASKNISSPANFPG